MSRERILADVRAALRQPMPAPEAHPHPVWPVATRADWATLADQFRAKFEGLGGKWHEAANGDELGLRLRAIASAAGGTVLVAKDPDGFLDRIGAADRLARAGVSVVRDLGDRSGADALGLSVTAATSAIAESGTFGLVAAPGQGRLASVIAPIHLTILTADRLVLRLGDFLAIAGPRLADRSASAAILVTGPSRTADIEGQLIVGVHGPREVHCILLEGV